MEQIPKIARARMAAQSLGPHPAAEQLNAFSENVLAANERENVLAHLATCLDCREIVGLAVESRPEGAPAIKPARGGFRWATLQWAAVAASVAIVTVAVLVVGPKEATAPHRATDSAGISRQQLAKSQPVAKVPESPIAELKASRVGGSKSDTDVKPKEAGKKINAGTSAGPYIADGAAITDGGFGGIGIYSRSKDQKSAPLGKMAEKKEVTPAEPAAKTAASRDLAYSAPASSANDTFYSSVPVNRPVQGSVQGGIVQNAAPPTPSVGGEGERAEAKRKTSDQISNVKRPDAAAQGSSESVEISTTAATIAPAPSSAAMHQSESTSAGRGGVSRFQLASPRIWRLRSGKIESSDDGGKKWQLRTPAKNFEAMKVLAAGLQIWAGGKAGALFLSRDNGQTWTKISLTGDHVIPLGDVTEIKVTNALLVEVILSSGDDWQSNDGGKSFRLSPRKP